jgi:uncharacterized membrane protein HdeD (DUF308 family)
MNRRRKRPPLDFWLWLAVIGVFAVAAGFIFLTPPNPAVLLPGAPSSTSASRVS